MTRALACVIWSSRPHPRSLSAGFIRKRRQMQGVIARTGPNDQQEREDVQCKQGMSRT